MQKRTLPFVGPEIGGGDILFTLKDVTYTPVSPRKEEPFTVRGKVNLFGIPFLAPVWVQARVTYPERWWEEIIPIIGSPTVSEGQMAVGGDFEVTFPRGFDREGEFTLEVAAYGGPTYSIDKMALPPFPPMASEETTFIVVGEVPPEEVGFRAFAIKRYGTAGKGVEAPGVVELEAGDILRIIVGFDHRDLAVTGKFHAAIWQKTALDPHDEVLDAEREFSVPPTPDWEYFEDYIDIPITSKIAPGTEYGLYVKIMGITGGDIFTEYLGNVVTIIGLPEEADFRYFRVLSYSKNGGEPVTPPGVIEVGIGDRLKINLGFEHRYLAASGEIHAAIWQWTLLDPHDEVLSNDKLFDVLTSTDWEPHEESIDILITPSVKAGSYGLYAKIMGITGADIFTSYLENVVTLVTEELQTLEVDITPTGTGYVTTEPDPEVGANHFVDGSTGKFRYDERVRVTAHPNEGYRFDHWSDEIEGGVSYNNPEYVAGTMTEHRAVKAHFRSIEVPEEMQVLEVDITPSGAGYVMTDPAPEVGTNYFVDGTTGKFKYGERVRVTAYPNPGYEFDHWSDEIEGGVSYNNPEYVAGTMTEHRAVKAHFRAIVEYEGTITRIELKYNGTQKAIPIYDIPQGSSGQVHVWGRNDTSEWQEMGIYIGVTLPDGRIVSYTDVSGNHCPGCDHEFIADRFDLQAPGEYNVSIHLYMSGKKVATYSGLLCTVAGLVELGTFTFYAMHMPPLYYVESWMVRWWDNGKYYDSNWASPTGPVTVSNAPLVGKVEAWIWTGTGDPIKYGPTAKYTLRDGGVYNYDISGNVLYTR